MIQCNVLEICKTALYWSDTAIALNFHIWLPIKQLTEECCGSIFTHWVTNTQLRQPLSQPNASKNSVHREHLALLPKWHSGRLWYCSQKKWKVIPKSDSWNLQEGVAGENQSAHIQWAVKAKSKAPNTQSMPGE